MNVVILAGGLGSRLAEETEVRPKPMVEIGPEPLLWHIMQGYACRGFRDFYIALGYKGEIIKRYFLERRRLAGNLVVDLEEGRVESYERPRENWRVHLIETGAATQTGGRLRRLAPELREGGTFLLTYGDGVSDVDPHDVLALHRRSGCLATITAVRPPARFGGIVFDGDRVAAFTEKPQIGEGWINGGFMAIEPEALELLQGDADVLEIALLERLADRGQLAAYRHDGYWQCMDVLREKQMLERLWREGNAPWKVWA